jgi:hypothetical protein
MQRVETDAVSKPAVGELFWPNLSLERVHLRRDVCDERIRICMSRLESPDEYFLVAAELFHNVE